MRFLIFPIVFLFSCRAGSVELSIAPGFGISKKEMKCIAELSGELGFDSAFEIQAGIFGKYDSSKAIAVKQIVEKNDTIRQEKWLYIWRREWTNSLFYSLIGDSSKICAPFVTGEKAIRHFKWHIYRHSGREKTFKLHGDAIYSDVRAILDCVINGGVAVDSAGWERTYLVEWRKRFEEKWNIYKRKILNFKSINHRNKCYTFCFDMTEKEHWEFVMSFERTENSCKLVWAYERPITY